MGVTWSQWASFDTLTVCNPSAGTGWMSEMIWFEGEPPPADAVKVMPDGLSVCASENEAREICRPTRIRKHQQILSIGPLAAVLPRDWIRSLHIIYLSY